MLEVDWREDKGWGNPEIKPIEYLMLHPSAPTFHYGVHLFEGMKAFKAPNGRISLFRPELNMNRMRHSSQRLCLPDFDGDELLRCIKELVRLEQDWIHDEKGYSLYIRPTHIGTMPILGVKKSDRSKIFVILSPVGPYFDSGFAPVNLYCENKQIRAWPFGTGCYKIGGNYGPTLNISSMAESLNCQQVLWLFNGVVTEIGSSNVFIAWKTKDGETEIVTHPADDLILHGVVRDSVISLAKEMGYKVSEKYHTIYEIIEAVKEGRFLECFTTGTAVNIGPVKGLYFEGKMHELPQFEAGGGPICISLHKKLEEIMYGNDDHHWTMQI